MITGNKGEWSEIYTFLKLLADGKLYAADADLNKISEIYYPILSILRKESRGLLKYRRNSEIKVLDAEDVLLTSIPIDTFKQKSVSLLKEIKQAHGAFGVSDIEEFLTTIKCTTIKADASRKGDITLVLHDLRTGLTPTVAFSIKSLLGGASTLLNAGKTTNFIYKITGENISDEVTDEINRIDTRSKIKDRLLSLQEKNLSLKFVGMENCRFKSNLQIIDTFLPEILSELLLKYYSGISYNVEELTNIIEKDNPVGFEEDEEYQFYDYKIKRFLMDVALGMMQNTPWTGQYDATGGYIIVKEDGEVVCYHIYNINEFQDYLFHNTRFETASSTRHDFGKVYKQDEDYLFKLNLQIRFLR